MEEDKSLQCLNPIFQRLEHTRHNHPQGEAVPEDLVYPRPGPDPAVPGRPRVFVPVFEKVSEKDVCRMFRARYRCQNTQAYPLVPTMGHSGAYTIRASEEFEIPPCTTVFHNTFLELWIEKGLSGIITDDPKLRDRKDVPAVWADAILDRSSRHGLEIKVLNPNDKPMRVYDGQGLAILYFVKMNKPELERTGVVDPTEEIDRPLSRASTPSTRGRSISKVRGRIHDNPGTHELAGMNMGRNVIHPEDDEPEEQYFIGSLLQQEESHTSGQDSSVSSSTSAISPSSSSGNLTAQEEWLREYHHSPQSSGDEWRPSRPITTRGEGSQYSTRQRTQQKMKLKRLKKDSHLVGQEANRMQRIAERNRIQQWLDEQEEPAGHPHVEEEENGNGRNPGMSVEPAPTPVPYLQPQSDKLMDIVLLTQAQHLYRPIPLREADMTRPPPASHFQYNWIQARDATISVRPPQQQI